MSKKYINLYLLIGKFYQFKFLLLIKLTVQLRISMQKSVIARKNLFKLFTEMFSYFNIKYV